MVKKIIFRTLFMLAILLVVSEIGLRIRLAYLYRSADWLFYHQFRFRTEEEINKEDMPYYYKDNMFKPFKLIFRQEKPKDRKEIITIESSALRSIRRQLQKIVENDPQFVWRDYSPNEKKEIEYSNNNIVLYELLVYPDIYNTLKRETRILKKILGPTIDDFFYNNLVFYMHIDENVNFTLMDNDNMLKKYLELLRSREEPFCKSIKENNVQNIFYVITSNRFNPLTRGGKIYIRYINAAYETTIALLKKYNVDYIDLMDEKLSREDFTDYFHFSPSGGKKMSYKILKYLRRKGL